MVGQSVNRVAGPFLTAVCEASNFGILCLDARGRIVAWNPWLAERTAVPQSEALGKTLAEVLPGTPEKTLALCADGLKTGLPRMLSPVLQGILIPFAQPSQQIGRLYPLHDGTDRVSGIALFLHDASEVLAYERRVAAHAKSEHREREEIFQAIGHPAFIFDRECGILSANRAALEIMGCSERELIGRRCYQAIYGADAPPPGCPLTGTPKTGGPRAEEITMGHPPRVFLASCTPLHDPAGRTDKIIHIAMDITDRDRAQAELNAKNRETALLNRVAIDLASIRAGGALYTYLVSTLKELAGAATATFGLYDPHQREIHVKHADLDPSLITDLMRSLGGRKLTEAGFPVSEAIRRDLIENPVRIQASLSEITFGLVPPWVGKVAQRVQRIDRFVGIAYVLDGELYGTSVLGLRAGRPTPSLEMLQSFANLAAVSLRRNQAEASLQLSEERYRAFVTQSSDAICRFEIEHPYIDTALPTDAQIDLLYDRAVIRECNRIFATSHSLTRPEELIEQQIGRIYPRTDRGNVETLRAFIETGYHLSDVETRERAPDGSIRYFLNSLIGHVENGRLVRIWCVKPEISRIKRAEEEIRILNVTLERRVAERTLQLERANKELEAFAYSVSHDLRAPLRAVNGYTRMLIEDCGPQLDAEGRRLCDAVSRSARNMGKLIEDLLAFSRLSRVEMRPASVDMETLARSVFLELTSPEDRGRIDFRLTPLPRARGDAALLRQVWTNLLSNAIKFSSRRERAVIEVDSQEREGETVYWVRDNGIGFDMRHADKLFVVFQSLHNLGEFESVGAGLAIVQRIIHRHNGRVWAEGQRDRGAVFYFTLGSEVRSETPPSTDKEAAGAR